MDYFAPSEMKTILHSKRANMYYLEHCRVLVNGGRVEYVTEQDKRSLYWNIPIANTTSILLGTGTSITQAAMRELAKAGVLVGFCGGGGTPLYSANDVQIDIMWFTPQSEYRPTEYLQAWVKFWFDDEKRLKAAKFFQKTRFDQIEKFWLSGRLQKTGVFKVDHGQLIQALNMARASLDHCSSSSDILAQEANFTKILYKIACSAVGYGNFTRAKRGAGTDIANRLLDHGNYLAYGLGATATWVLGIPHGLAVLHGKTRRGGLVFDVADLVKDALVLPQAFISAMIGDEDQEFRGKCLEAFSKAEALDIMIDTIKGAAFQNVKVFALGKHR
jgi:CRISPR-associated protein Cas1